MAKSKRLRDASNLGWIKRLIDEEQQAVDLYRQAIATCEDEKCLDVFTHILQEELEHVQELEQLKEEITKPVETKDKKFKDGKVTYIVVVNGERYASFDNIEDAWQCEDQFYSNLDEDAENYYGPQPDVRIIKEDEFGRRIRDARHTPKNKSLRRG